MQSHLDGDGGGVLRQAPQAGQLSWVDPAFADPSVDYAARYTYDYNYQGTGNWPFNTAYSHPLPPNITGRPKW